MTQKDILWQKDIERLLPGAIYQIVVVDGEEQLDECDKLRVVKIMSQTQNWNCSEIEAVERIKKSSDTNPFSIGDEQFWYKER